MRSILLTMYALAGPQEDADAALALARVRVPQLVVVAPAPDDFYVRWLDTREFTRGCDLPTVAGNADLGEQVAIARAVKGGYITYATLSSPTLQQVKAALAEARQEFAAEKAVSRLANPKSWPLASARHDLDLATGPWPESIPFPVGMERYRRAAFTQEIAVTNGRDRITPVPRLNLLAKWHVSGGMEGIENFRSDLYRHLPEEPQAWVGNISVLNSLGYMQDNRGWKVLFPDGTKFMDVLSNEGKVFEVRQRKKENGKWQASILFEDQKQRPVGYSGLTVSCNSCHGAAGTGGYATGLVPGGDGVLSVGFKALERDR